MSYVPTRAAPRLASSRRFLVMMGQFWPPGMDPLAEDCKWYQAACINVVVHALRRTGACAVISNPSKSGESGESIVRLHQRRGAGSTQVHARYRQSK